MTNLLRKPPVSAALGGLIVGAFFWIAIAAGWIEASDDGPAAQAPLTRPVAGDGESKDDGKALTVNQIYDKDAEGVVFVEAAVSRDESSPFDLLPQRQEGRSTGSGFVIDRKGLVVTNAHVVDGARDIRVKFGDDRSRKAEKVGQDSSTDLAVLRVKVNARNLHPLKLGDSDKVRVGDPVVAIGNPFGLDRTVTSGIVSALQRRIEAPNGFTISDVIQTDASINPGNSGGPLLDGRGEVIGINSQIATAGGGGSVGVGFAVPVNTARKVIDDLREDGQVRHAFLGVTGLTLEGPVTENLNLPVSKGVLVQEVTRNGPADKAGIRGGSTEVSVGGVDLVLGGDILTEIDGDRITTMDQVVDIVSKHKPGDRVKVELLRGEKKRTVTVKLGNRPERSGLSQQGGR